MDDAGATIRSRAVEYQREGRSEPIDPEHLCGTYAPRVYRFAAMVSRNPDEAEDLAQEAMIRAIRGLPGFDPKRGTVEAWLWQIVINASRDAGRVAQRRRALTQRAIALMPRPSSYGSESPTGASNLDLLEAVQTLPARPRALIALRFGADLDYENVGRLLGISAVAARVATRRALIMLRGRLEPSVEEGT